MKKLVAILVISLLAVGLFAVENPFTFSIDNLLRAKFSDSSQPGYMSDSSASYDENGDLEKPNAVGSSDNLFKSGKVELYMETKGKASKTFGEIYTLGLWVKNGITVGDTIKDGLTWGIDNKIQVIEDYLAIQVNVEYGIDFANGSGLTSALSPKLVLGGSIPDANISWEIYDRPKLKFNLYAWAYTNPTRKGYETDAEEANGYFGTETTSEKGFFNELDNEARIKLSWDFLKLADIEGISGKLTLVQDMNIIVPYSYYFEKYKTLKFDGEVAVSLGLAGFGLDLKFLYATADYLATHYGAKGHMGSYYDYNNSTDTYSAATSPSGTTYTANVDMPAESAYRPANGTLQMGPRVAFNFATDLAKFTFQWTGTASGLRDENLDKNNSGLK